MIYIIGMKISAVHICTLPNYHTALTILGFFQGFYTSFLHHAFAINLLKRERLRFF